MWWVVWGRGCPGYLVGDLGVRTELLVGMGRSPRALMQPGELEGCLYSLRLGVLVGLG